MSIVLDTSMTIAWLFEGERTEGALLALPRIAAQGGLVPSLWRLEVANVLRNAVRRGRCDEAFVSRALDRLARLPITIDSETDHHAWAATRDLAREEDLTLYDSAYLELAIRKNAPIASFDKALIGAAIRRGVSVLAG